MMWGTIFSLSNAPRTSPIVYDCFSTEPGGRTLLPPVSRVKRRCVRDEQCNNKPTRVAHRVKLLFPVPALNVIKDACKAIHLKQLMSKHLVVMDRCVFQFVSLSRRQGFEELPAQFSGRVRRLPCCLHACVHIFFSLLKQGSIGGVPRA